MDGDQTAKTFEQGANSALKENELTSGIHESVKQTVSTETCHRDPIANCVKPSEGEKTQGGGTSLFDKSGALGKQFTGTHTFSRLYLRWTDSEDCQDG